MSYRPSKRKAEEEGELNLNLNSMMDMFGVLIPALLMMSAVVEASIINVVAPSTGPSDEAPPPAADKPPLNLTVSIIEGGFIVSGSEGVLSDEGGPVDVTRPSIPVIEKPVGCSKYRGTWPPPRAKNKDVPPCEDKRLKIGEKETQRSFWVYDIDALARQIISLKDKYPQERRVIISPAKTVEYETLVDVMDATREVKEPNGELRMLFDEVIIGASL